MNQSIGISHYWSQGDAITHGIAYVLIAMSIVSWYYIFAKAWSAWRVRRCAEALDSFWKAPTLNDATAVLKTADTENVYT
ncbi:MAG TPA: MotA/TolQ/ExbB proton channel family protein, partial [Noviherbaspirillum sp.]